MADLKIWELTGGTFNVNDKIPVGQNDTTTVYVTGQGIVDEVINVVTGTTFVDTYVTGGTHVLSAGTTTFVDNQGGDFDVTGYFDGDYNTLTNKPTQVWRTSTGTDSIENTKGSISVEYGSLAFNTSNSSIYNEGNSSFNFGTDITVFDSGSTGNFIFTNGINTSKLTNSFIFGDGYSGGEIDSDNFKLIVFTDSVNIGKGNSNIHMLGPGVVGSGNTNCAIIGGGSSTLTDNLFNSVVIGGTNHIVSGTTNTVVIAGSGITATESNTVYTPQLIPTSLKITSNAGNGKVLTSDVNGNATWAPVPFEAATLTTGTTLDFTTKKIWNSFSSPGIGNITGTTVGAQYGISQKMYHSGSTEPTVPGTWRQLGDGVYVPNEVNIMFFEWAGGSRVEYWVVQEQ